MKITIFHLKVAKNLQCYEARNHPALKLYDKVAFGCGDIDVVVAREIFNGNHLPHLQYVAAAEVESELPFEQALEAAFEKTNSFDHPWHLKQDDALKHFGSSFRSTSVGDIFRVSGIAHSDQLLIVKGMGFEQII